MSLDRRRLDTENRDKLCEIKIIEDIKRSTN